MTYLPSVQINRLRRRSRLVWILFLTRLNPKLLCRALKVNRIATSRPNCAGDRNEVRMRGQGLRGPRCSPSTRHPSTPSSNRLQLARNRIEAFHDPLLSRCVHELSDALLKLGAVQPINGFVALLFQQMPHLALAHLERRVAQAELVARGNSQIAGDVRLVRGPEIKAWCRDRCRTEVLRRELLVSYGQGHAEKRQYPQTLFHNRPLRVVGEQRIQDSLPVPTPACEGEVR
ncbi:hypothetical protein VT03_13415 [Planctomyces sp. SH-PL14]|nr:hypothetical protein VT03_13415 [Planctomyces sp. SH-PL14]